MTAKEDPKPAEEQAPVEEPKKAPVIPETEVELKARNADLEAKLKSANAEAAERRKKLEIFEADEAKREEAKLSELQLAQKRAAEAEAKATELQVAALRRQVADETGLPPALADRLKGTTAEEMTTDAQKLLESLPKSTNKVAPHIPPTNPSNASPGETEQQMRERLFGRSGNAFDINAIEAGGGGVVWGAPKKAK